VKVNREMIQFIGFTEGLIELDIELKIG